MMNFPKDWFDIQFWYHSIFCCFIGQNTSRNVIAGVFQKPKNQLLVMGTRIFKIDEEMAEIIEVEVGNPHLESDRAV